MGKTPPGYKGLNIDIPERLHKRIWDEKDKRGVTIPQVVISILTTYFDAGRADQIEAMEAIIEKHESRIRRLENVVLKGKEEVRTKYLASEFLKMGLVRLKSWAKRNYGVEGDTHIEIIGELSEHIIIVDDRGEPPKEGEEVDSHDRSEEEIAADAEKAEKPEKPKKEKKPKSNPFCDICGRPDHKTEEHDDQDDGKRKKRVRCPNCKSYHPEGECKSG